jgi:hypothetical protein
MKFANATKLDRKSGVAEWRDLLFHLILQRRKVRPYSFRLTAAPLELCPSRSWNERPSRDQPPPVHPSRRR